MQTISFAGQAQSLVLEEAATLFNWASTADLSPEVYVFDCWQPLLDELAKYSGQPAAKATRGLHSPAPPAKPVKRAVVAFSGGKDSLSAALELRERGVRPALLYCEGINGATGFLFQMMFLV